MPAAGAREPAQLIHSVLRVTVVKRGAVFNVLPASPPYLAARSTQFDKKGRSEWGAALSGESWVRQAILARGARRCLPGDHPHRKEKAGGFSCRLPEVRQQRNVVTIQP